MKRRDFLLNGTLATSLVGTGVGLAASAPLAVAVAEANVNAVAFRNEISDAFVMVDDQIAARSWRRLRASSDNYPQAGRPPLQISLQAADGHRLSAWTAEPDSLCIGCHLN